MLLYIVVFGCMWFYIHIFRGEDPSTNRYGLYVSESVSESVSQSVLWKVWNMQYQALDKIRWYQMTTDDIIWPQMTSDDIRLQ